ncbi:endonuclease III domain-containing protein [Dehalogenimonas etheniformans]|uniref:Endonuclease III domain-containing protein n=2 Tax=Dehalogenimonas etheniformans TaxID=1536648 RepID=A0A2P5P751_9CHLR|nr:endonuclease III domain-containing protein [Dehalogenimonas etheniformans]QNT75520.1 endonuclease III domain-containing protein [Dehalogenimonas etheniformans]
MTGKPELRRELIGIHNKLLACYGVQHWWPGETPFEIMVGAILTQSAAWGNVEKAITNLKSAGKLSPSAIRDMPMVDLAKMVYPSGYYNAKARKLKALAEWLGKYKDDLSRLDRSPTVDLRQELLEIYGVGPETSDAILLYVFKRPVFVIDAYTRRLFRRLGVEPPVDNYDGWQALFMDNLPHEFELFAEYHALIVKHGKDICRKSPQCTECCLSNECSGKPSATKPVHLGGPT